MWLGGGRLAVEESWREREQSRGTVIRGEKDETMATGTRPHESTATGTRLHSAYPSTNLFLL